MKRTPDQEASRKARQRRTAMQPRCIDCGQLAALNQSMCGACISEATRRSEIRLNTPELTIEERLDRLELKVFDLDN